MRNESRSILVLLLFGVGQVAASGDPLPELGEPRSLAAGEVHDFEVDLGTGDFFHLAVEQDGVDLFLRLLDPNGAEIHVVDSPTGAHGPEELVVLAPAPGRYQVEVAAFGEPSDREAPGRYAVLEKTVRPASTADRALVSADLDERKGEELLDAGAFTEAGAVLDRALTVWQELGLPRRAADTQMHLGRLHSLAGNATTASAAYEAAADGYRTLGVWRRLSVALLNAAKFDLERSAPETALARTREALPLFELRVDPSGIAFAALTLARRGMGHFQLGELQPALRDLRNALERSRGTGRRDIEATILTELAEVELDLDRLESALRHARAAERIFRDLGPARELAHARQKAVAAAARLGRLEEAERAGREALEGLPLENRRERALVLSGLAHVLRRRGDLAGAQTTFQSALELVRGHRDNRTKAILLTGLGHLLGLRGDPEQGLARLEEARHLFDELGDLDGQAMSRARSAELLRDLGRFDAAWDRIAESLDRVERLRGAMARRDLRLSFFGLRQDYHEIAVDILLRGHARHPRARYDLRALAVHDRRLARELVERLAQADPRSAADPRLLAEEEELEEQVRELARAPWHVARDLQVGAILEELEDVRGEIRRAARRPVAARTPDDLDGGRLVEDLLDPGTLLLVYALGDEQSTLWSSSLESTAAGRHLRHRVYRLPDREILENLARSFNAKLSSPRRSDQRRREEFGHRLADLLLGPVAEELGGQRLVLVVDGALRAVPFAALPPPRRGIMGGFPRRGTMGNHLIERHEIVRIPSLGSLRELRRRVAERPPSAQRVAVFADPVFEPRDQRFPRRAVSRSAPVADPGADLGRLAGTAAEAHAIVELAGRRDVFLATGFQASRETFLETPLSDYRILHVATHALPHSQPELAGLVFSRFDAEGRPRDGFVRLFEITRLELSADLVVLSACQTNVGRDIRGEGMLGLAWGFFQAGAVRVVASLWEVSDDSTARLMREFYTAHFADGMAPAAALRRAQLRILRQPGSSPWDWAGFLFRGDWRDTR